MQSYGGATASAAPQQLPIQEQPQPNVNDATLRNSNVDQLVNDVEGAAGVVIRGGNSRHNSSGENSRCESDDEYHRNQPRSATTFDAIKTENERPNAFAPSTTQYGAEQNSSEQPSGSNNMEGASPMASYNEERMRRKLQFFFMNPIEKWYARRKFPYKFVVQVSKVSLLSLFVN